jgi:regulator of protease activity HflC (stomatin/prohibitin superfamily)
MQEAPPPPGQDCAAPASHPHAGAAIARLAPAYMRAAFVPMLAFCGLLAWGLDCVTLVPMDARAIYERFGAPTAVLHPGLHVGLPWPLGSTRALELGTVHEIGLAPRPATADPPLGTPLGTPGLGATSPGATPVSAAASPALTGADGPTTAAADRLRKAPHPGEIALVTASDTNDRQGAQSIIADLRVFYRTGLSDADALRAAYATAEPEALVRALAGRVTAAYFAARTLDAVLRANREEMAATLRTRLQAALDQHATGLEAIGMVIETIRPPAGAAGDTDNTRAAEIAARTSVAVAHGEAAASAAQSRQRAYDMTSAAHADAAESVSRARADLIRFNADRQAAQAGGQSFLLERYFNSLGTALAHTPKIIIDHRLNYPEAPVLDLRPYAAAGGGGGKDE